MAVVLWKPIEVLAALERSLPQMQVKINTFSCWGFFRLIVCSEKDHQSLNRRLHHASPKTILVLATTAPPRRWGDGAKRKVGPLSLSYVSYGVQLSTSEEWAAASRVV